MVRTTSMLYRRIGLAVFVCVLALAFPAGNSSAANTKLDEFARCLTKQKAVMYGAFWCENCKKQKELFGSSFSYATYQECALIGAPRSQTEQCKYLQIRKYPTWIFSDNERREGLQTLESLRDKTGCKLP